MKIISGIATKADWVSIKVITFLACIDVMRKGIQQLYRVFFDTTNTPFIGEKSVFKKGIDVNSNFLRIPCLNRKHIGIRKNSSKRTEKDYAAMRNDNHGNNYSSYRNSIAHGDAIMFLEYTEPGIVV